MKLVITDDSNIESNEVDQKAMGGTELMKYALYDRLDKDLASNFQIIPSRVRELHEDKIKVYWLHDLPGDPESQHLKNGGWDKFDKLVFVSYWQQQQYRDYLGVPFEKGIVLRNAIVPFTTIDKPDPAKELRLIYHTTPHRGLELLVPVFEHLAKEFPHAVLDVYSSFNAYGWPQRDEPYKELFKKCEEHPQINYHGYQPNEVVRKALDRAHIFAYPSIWPETSCIALLEAMSAGCLCVHSSLAALPETSANWTYMYQYQENHQHHASAFYASLKQSMEMLSDPNKNIQVAKRLTIQKQYVDAFYNWDLRASEWHNMLNSLLIKKNKR